MAFDEECDETVVEASYAVPGTLFGATCMLSPVA